MWTVIKVSVPWRSVSPIRECLKHFANESEAIIYKKNRDFRMAPVIFAGRLSFDLLGFEKICPNCGQVFFEQI